MKLLLADSIIQVTQRVPALPLAVQEALAADSDAAPTLGGVDADNDMTYCATSQHVLAWRTSSAAPTAFQFLVPSCSAPLVPPFCSFLPRPLSATAEPALLLCSATGRLAFWGALSDSLTTSPDHSLAQPALGLRAHERVTAVTRVNDSQVLAGTSLGRLFRICVRMQHDQQRLFVDEVVVQKGFLGRWLGGSSMRESELAVQALVIGASIDTGHVLGVVVSSTAVHVWRLPIGPFAESQEPTLMFSDLEIGRALCMQLLNAEGLRYSAALAQHVKIVDGAYDTMTGRLALLVMDSSSDITRFAIALMPLHVNQSSVKIQKWISLQYKQTHDPRALALPTLHFSQSRPSIAYVTFAQAVSVVLLSENAYQEESMRLRHGVNRIVGGCVPADPQCVRWIGLTTESGMLHMYVDVQRALQHMQDLQPNSLSAQEARAGRLEECLERAMCFEEPHNPLMLDALPGHLDKNLVEMAIRHVSVRLLDSSLRRLRPTVDLRSQLAQRLAFSQHLVQVLEASGYLEHLSVTLRALLRAHTELLVGACDLWRYYDTGKRPALLSQAIKLVLGMNNERLFFETGLTQVTTLFYGLRRLLNDSTSVECTRLMLALLLGSLRYREENTKLYRLPLIPQVEFEPWYATSVCIGLLEDLFEYVEQHYRQNGPEAELRTHASALSELILASYDARLASLLTEEEREHVADSFIRARMSLLPSLQHMGCADKAYALAERYRDFRTLVRLCLTERRMGDESAEAAADVRIAHYLDVYDWEFADELYLYYIQQREFRRLLSPRTEHAELVTAFFRRYPRYAKIAWLHGISVEHFTEASRSLWECAEKEEEDILDKETMLSLSKLLLLGSLMEPSIEEERLQSQLEVWDDALDLVMVQRRLFKRWCQSLMVVTSTPEILAENVASVLAVHLNQQPALRALFVDLATQVADARVASVLNMAELLSLTDRSFAARPDAVLNDPTVAIQLLGRLLQPSEVRDMTLACVWRRVYLMDDWHALGDTTTLTDDDVLERLYGTVGFQTAYALLMDSSTADMYLAPHVLCDIPAPTMELLGERFPGLAEEQLRGLHEALSAEHAALEALTRDSMLIPFMERAAVNIKAEKRERDKKLKYLERMDKPQPTASAPAMPGAAPEPTVVADMDEGL